MASDRRGVRSSSRLTTPTAAPPTAPKAAFSTPRTARARVARSVSRDVESAPPLRKPTRRSVRQASVTSMASNSEHDAQPARKAKRNAPEPVRDLTTVEEVDTQIDLNDAPQTPPHHEPEDPIAFISPGAASEMSGTTAISSFSTAEAAFLDPKFILRRISKLSGSVKVFLDHLVPANNTMKDDADNIREMQKPDSDFNEGYRDFDDEFSTHLKHFIIPHHDFILPRAIHAALFGPDRDLAAMQTGIDLILYLTNTLVFAKLFIHSDRHEKKMWDTLRNLDNTFPSYFLLGLTTSANVTETPSGESALLGETFDLALDLRTQLAILVLQRDASKKDFVPEDSLVDVFCDLTTSQDGSGKVFLKGWATPALGDDDLILTERFWDRVQERLKSIRDFFLEDAESLERGDLVDLDGLSANYPWDAVLLRLLEWVRRRSKELTTSIDVQGGVEAIVGRIKKEIQEPSVELSQEPSQPRLSPRKKRTSFLRDRRRSSRRFDPNAPVDTRVIEALRAKERGAEAQAEVELLPQEKEMKNDAPLPDNDDERPEHSADEYQPQLGDDLEEQVEETLESSGPPQSTAEYLKVFKEVTRTEKENRTISIFDRQADAERVEFGDGFDESQATPGPSTKGKGKQHAQQPLPRKRPLEADDEAREQEAVDDDEDDAFETAERSAQVHERRRKAPVAKKVRIDPGSSNGAPPSHQRPQDSSEALFVSGTRGQEDSFSEPEAPDMTEVPPSSYQAQRILARQNFIPFHRERKARVDWTAQSEEIFAEYMREYPQQYSKILQVDSGLFGRGVLTDRTQVNLKDKARNMAINMVKSGIGIKPGFENVITPKIRQQLLDLGFVL